MQVDVERSERLTRQARPRPRAGPGGADPRAAAPAWTSASTRDKALAATGRYLKLAMDEFGREDLAVVSYHMGIGNLQQVLGAYGDDDGSYAQLFFDASPDRHPRAYRLLAGLGDDSKTYLWRVLASREIMRLYREDRAELERRAGLHGGRDSGELVLHPPGETPALEDGLDDAAAAMEPRTSCARWPAELPAGGVRAARLHPRRRPERLGHERRSRHATSAPARTSTRPASRSTSAADYASGAQAEAFQYMLDRLQALNLIAWVRDAGRDPRHRVERGPSLRGDQ